MPNTRLGAIVAILCLEDDDEDNAVNDDPHVEEEGSSAGCLVFSVGPLI